MKVEKDTGIAPSGYHQRYYGDRDWHTYSAQLARIIRYSRPGPILDIGAGCGYLVEAAMQWGLECIGVEGAEEGVALAKKRVAGMDIRQHKLSEPLPFSDSSFQTVVMNQVIEHLEPHVMKLTIKEIYRVLQPGGMVLILSPSAANRKEWAADPTHINLLTPTELKAELTKCGFKKISPFNSPLNFFGKSWVGRGVMFVIFQILNLDLLSATANAMAFRPDSAD